MPILVNWLTEKEVVNPLGRPALTERLSELLSSQIFGAAGTGIFQSLTFVRFHLGAGFDRDGIEPSQRLLMSVVRVYAIVGRKPPDIRIEGNDVRIKSGARIIALKFDD